MTFRLYATRTSSSFQRVSKGLLEGLLFHGVKPEGVVFVDEVSHPEDPPIAGFTADVGLLIGPPSAAAVLSMLGQHKRRIVHVAPNSDQLGSGLVHLLKEHATEIIVPSKWAKGIVERHLDLPVHVVRHGVTNWEGNAEHAMTMEMQLARLRSPEEPMRFAHFSTTASGRKGTLELVKAWELFREKLGSKKNAVQLLLILDMDAHVWLTEQIADCGVSCDGIMILNRIDMRDEQSVLRNFHVICQPSTGEGFGMIPLEAMAAGVPVIATGCTGHSEYMGEYSRSRVVLSVGEEIPVYDELPDAKRPTVDPKEIAAALLEVGNNWLDYSKYAEAAAKDVQKNWSWFEVSKPLIEILKEKS